MGGAFNGRGVSNAGRAFSLVELLTVVAIVAILVANMVIVARYAVARARAVAGSSK